MGHTRLGELPRTRKWLEVIGLLAIGAHVSQVANAVIRAAERGLNLGAEHKALVEAFWLLTQLPAAARSSNFVAALRDRGLKVSDHPGLMDLAGAVSEAVDARIPNNVGRTDLGEMAQASASECLVERLTPKMRGLFGASPEDLRRGLAQLATVKSFGSFTRQFYARLTEKLIQYYVSRTTANHVGNSLRFPTLAAKAAFDSALSLHCSQASRIVETFAGEWFSKTTWEKNGISRDDARGFTHVAMAKIVAELKAGAK
jgi:hypothetical protein